MRAEHFRQANLPVRIPRGYDDYWAVIRTLHAEKGEFTVADLDGETTVTTGSVRTYLRLMVKVGVIALVEQKKRRARDPKPANVYRLVRDQVAPPRIANGKLVTKSPVELVWTAVRTFRSFGLRELVFAASTDELQISQDAARQFLNRLTAAGYLVVTQKPTKGHAKAWRLKPGMDTGPKPPQRRVIRANAMWDPNKGAFVGAAPIAAEATP